MRNILTFVVMSLVVGCGDGKVVEVAPPELDSMESDRKETAASASSLRGSFQVFDPEQGSWLVSAEMADLEPAEIASFIEKVFEDVGAPPARVTLTRDGDLFGVGRERDGGLSLGVTTKLGSEWFEATEWKDVELSAALKVFHTFVNRDEAIRTTIEWDDVVD